MHFLTYVKKNVILQSITKNKSVEELKKLMREDHLFQLSDEMMDKLCACMTEVHVPAKQPIITWDKVNTNVYIVKEGILRRSYLNGDVDCTNGFALPGTTIISYFSYYHGLPSNHRYEACVDSVVMVVTKEDYERLICESHEFARYVNSMLMAQLFHDEKKMSVFSGDARERYIALMKNRPESLRSVSLGVIASYLGVSQAYLSRLRQSLTKGK